jgi:hypothetical protein
MHAHDATRRWPGKYRGGGRRFSAALPALLLATIGAMCAAGGEASAKSKPESWKAIGEALLRVNDMPVKDWNVYQTGRKADPLVLQMGNRFLLIEVHDRQLFEIDPSKIARKSDDDILWDPSDRAANPLATSAWVEDDVGEAFRIGAKIDSEERVLDLQLPHPQNVGSLPAHTATPRRGGR